jgi:hypothetical protein
MRVLKERRPPRAHDEHVLALNYATLGIVDEILWLPSAAVAATTVTLLYGAEIELPDRFLAQVGKGTPASVVPLLVRATPMAVLLPSRLGPAAAWRTVASDLGGARALARQRYRALQTSLMTTSRVSSDGPDSLVRHTYGTRARWSWSEAARRVLARVVILNRAALALLIARPQSLTSVPWQNVFPLPARLPDRALASLAEALPPLVIPDFQSFAECLTPMPPVLAGEESIERYRSLFAEMLSFAGPPREARA